MWQVLENKNPKFSVIVNSVITCENRDVIELLIVPKIRYKIKSFWTMLSRILIDMAINNSLQNSLFEFSKKAKQMRLQQLLVTQKAINLKS